MKTYNGGSAVKGGYYLSTDSWEIHPVKHDGDRLPGAARYVRIPLPLLFLVMPTLGGLMVVFMPFIGLYLAGREAVRRIAGGTKHALYCLATTVSPGWAPGVSYFTGRKSAPAKSVAAETTADALAKEIADKRK